MRRLGLQESQVCQVIQALDRKNFVKSMTTYADHRIWQDVYRSEWDGVPIYIKFQKSEEYFVISFKEWIEEEI
jgi:motility quorum-sensing regulator/GCU-specific mRNA interferase toxin